MSESSKSKRSIGRRQFMGTTAAGITVLSSNLVRGTQANSAVRLGIIGCGGRGSAVGTGFVKNTNTRITALADLFKDQIEKGQDRFNKLNAEMGHPSIDPKQLFQGAKAAQKIANSKEVDVILISSPPYFHPEHLDIVVKAGKHAYCEKPVAVDVPGAKKVMQIGKKAQGKLSLDVGFQIRNATAFVELTKKIHAGAIGTIASAQAYYYAGLLGRPTWPNAKPDEQRLRNWVWDRVLSGDIIVEQNIHVIDVCNWVLKGHPISAAGAGARGARSDSGDAYGHFQVAYTYPGDVDVAFSSTQYNRGWWDVCERFFGDKGVSEAHYSEPVAIYGDEPWNYFEEAAKKAGQSEGFSATGSFGGALDDADSEKQKAFIDSITSGNYHNQADHGAESALTAMLGREAAYSGEVITWDKLLKSKKKWDAKLNISKMG